MGVTLHRCPDCSCQEPPPQPASSSPGIRALAKQATAEAVRAAREKRTVKPTKESTAHE